jgi:DNA-binding response OmpR family regulator
VTDDTSADRTTILIVEDEEDLADMYGAYLDDEFDVEVVYSGERAMETLDERIDIVLLDRRMPVVSGNEVLAYLEEAGIDCRVAMVTAVNPDFDIIDLRIDDYLVKPVSRDDVLKTVDRMLKLEQYNERMQELTSKKLKRNVLELEKTKAELAESEEFERLNQEIARLEADVEEISESLDTENLQP